MNIGTLTIEMAANVARLSKDMDAARRTVERTFGSIEKDVARLKGLLDSLFAGLSVSAFVGKLVDVQRQFDVLNSSLITVTGSSAAAAREFAWIKQFAATTPFQLAEVTEAFVKMKALGLDASQAALASYGNTASAMGKSLNQMIEAVADAATGEFERLKEFGIKAKQQGDQVTFTFQGVSKTVGNSAAEITAYLQAIGNNEFAGAMAQRAQTLDGAISNLADTWDELFRTINQQPAGGLIYDSVKLASGAIEDMITILNALNGATAENAKQTGAMKVIQEGIAIVFETVAVLGVNLKYVLEQIGTEIGGLAAQAAAVAQLDFSAAREIGRMMREDAAAARREVDALSERILNSRSLAEQARQSMQGGDTREQAEGVRQVGIAAADTKKKVKDLGDEFAAQREAARGWADAYQDFARIAAQASAESLGLTKAQARLVEFLSSPAYASASEPMRQLALEQAYAAIAAEQNAAAHEQQAKALEAMERSAESAEEQLQRLLDEERALVIAAERNITLAQAIEEVAIARLREQQAALMREGGREAEVQAIQREIDARERLAEAIGRKEAREAAAESAREAEREWRRTAENIERSLTDALMRGFESGKDIASAFRDTVVNMFKTMVLRPVVQAVVVPVAGGITGALGLPGVASAAETVGHASGVLSGVASAAETVGHVSGVLSGVGNLFSGLGTLSSALGLGLGAGFSSIAAAGIGGWLSAGTSLIGTGTLGGIGAGLGLLAGPIGLAASLLGGALKGLFGRKLKDYGIEGTFGGDGFTGKSYKFYKGGLLRSNKTKRRPLDPELDQALDQQFMAIKSSVASMAQALGLGTDAIANFTARIKVSFKGLNEQQIQEKLAETLGGVGDKMAASLLKGTGAVIRAGETAGEALKRLGGSLLAVNEAFDAMGLATLNASVASGEAASQIVDAFGGLDAFAQATSAYYEAMYSETEKVGKAWSDLGEKFQALGVSVPASVDAFRDLVAAQDLATASGRKTFSQLVQLGPAFAGLKNQMQKKLNDFADEAKRLQAQLLELQGDTEGAKKILRSLAIEGMSELEIAAYDANEALRAQIQALQERSSLEERLLQLQGDTAALRARELAKTDAANRSVLQQIWAIEDSRAATDAAFAALERAIDAQRKSVTAMRDAAREQVDSITAVFDVLKSNIEELYNEAASTSAMSAAAGQAFIAQALETARSTGYLPEASELAQAIRAARGGLDSGRYASAFEAERDRLVLAGRLSQLREISGNQLTIAEQQLKAAEQQLESLDAQLATARAQLDALRGVDQRVLTVEQAIRELNAAMAAELRALGGALAASKAPSAPYSVNDTPAERQAKVEYQTGVKVSASDPPLVAAAKVLYQSINGGASTAEYNAAAAAVGGDIGAALGWNGTREDAERIRKKYGFAAGGLHGGGVRMVGEKGPEIEVTGPARYYSAGQTAAMLGGGAAVANEVRQLREENQAQARAMVQLQARVTRLLERWDGDGMPETRRVTA